MKRYIKTYSELLTLEQFLEKYCSNLSPDWDNILGGVNEAFSIRNEKDYQEFLRKWRLFHYDYHKMKNFYDQLIKRQVPLDDDVLRYISFLEGFGYFEKIGNPSIEQWLNARDFNRPFDDAKMKDNEGFSIMEVLHLPNGGNAIRNQLLSSMKWVLA
jgi:hypothetical protein